MGYRNDPFALASTIRGGEVGGLSGVVLHFGAKSGVCMLEVGVFQFSDLRGKSGLGLYVAGRTEMRRILYFDRIPSLLEFGGVAL